MSSQIIEPDAVDAARYPRFAEAPYVDLVLREGRIAFKHSRDTPCVLHSNGHKGILSYLAPHLPRLRLRRQI